MKHGNLRRNSKPTLYTPEDIQMAYHLQNKFENVNTIAKDSCFHFGYMNKADGDEDTSDGHYSDENRHDMMTKKISTSQSILIFDLDGNINGQESGKAK